MIHCHLLCPYVEVTFYNHNSSIKVIYKRTHNTSCKCFGVCKHTPTRVRAPVFECVCACVCAVPLCCWWLRFRIVSRLSVINVPGRVGPKRYITNRRGGRVHRGRKGIEKVGARAKQSGKRNEEEEKGDGGERGGSIGKEKERGVGAAFSWVLLCFPLCKAWSPAVCQQAK